MPTTSNFGWTTPADTDLVKDGAAAIRTLGNGIDTSLVDLKGGTTNQVLAKNSNTDLDFKWVADASGIPATIFDAKGDIIAATAADTAARLAVGANGTVLTADSAEATGLKWAAAAAGTSWSLLSTTTLTGASTITVTGISNKDKILVVIPLASSVNNNVSFRLRFNSDTGTNYYAYGNRLRGPSTYDATVTAGYRYNAEDHLELGVSQNTNAYAYISGALLLNGGASSGIKSFQYTGGGVNIGYNSQESFNYTGYYNSSSTISSVSIISTSGNFDDGTISIYTSN